MKRKKNQVFIDPEVALSIVPQEVQNGVKFASFSGVLDVRDNVHNIRKCDDNVEGVPKQLRDAFSKKQVTYEYGTLDLEAFQKKLKQGGITDVKVTQTSEPDGVLTTKLKLPAEEIEINISEKGTHIICEGKQSSRLKVRDVLMSCMNKF